MSLDRGPLKGLAGSLPTRLSNPLATLAESGPREGGRGEETSLFPSTSGPAPTLPRSSVPGLARRSDLEGHDPSLTRLTPRHRPDTSTRCTQV